MAAQGAAASKQRRERLRTLLEERVAQDGYPLSAGQRALWFVQGLDPESWAYNVVFGARIRAGSNQQPLHKGALEQALGQLLERHQSLRCVIEERQGEPYQRLVPASAFALEVFDGRSWGEGQLREALEAFTQRPFRLAEEIPCRFGLFRLAPKEGALEGEALEEDALVMVFHHIAVDFWSIGVLLEELHQLYPAWLPGLDSPGPSSLGTLSPLAPSGESYRMFVDRQRQHLAGEEGLALRRYWRHRLGDQPPVLELPLDRPRPAAQTFAGATREFVLPQRAALRLRHLAGLAGSTFFAAMLGLVQLLLSRWSGQRRLLVAAPVSGRDRPEIQGTVGYFVNLVALEADLTDQPIFLDFLRQVGSTTLEALQHGELPFAEVVEELGVARDPSRAPLADVAFALESPRMDRRGIFPLLLGQSEAEAEIAGLRWQSLGLRQQEGQFDLNFHLLEGPQAVDGLLMFRTDLFDPSTADRLVAHLCHLLEAATAAPHESVSHFSMLSSAERWQLLREWNQGSNVEPVGNTVVDSFLAVAEASPDALAVASGELELGYGGLEDLSRLLATHLANRGVGPEVVVATLLPNSVRLVLAQLAILRAGGAFLSIDPSFPKERIEFLLEDSAAHLMITDLDRTEGGVLRDESNGGSGSSAFALETVVLETVVLETGDRRVGSPKTGERTIGVEGALDSKKPLPSPDPEHLAYLIYTSGSTGRPKAVATTHGGLSNLLRWHLTAYSLGTGHRLSQLAGQSFDASVWETWPALASGASLHIADGELRVDPHRLWGWLAEQRITHAFAPTPLAEALMIEEIPADLDLRVLLTGGDRLRRRPSQGLSWDLVNHYGPSECSVVATAGAVSCLDRQQDSTSGGAPSLGRPILGVEALVLDRSLRLVPLGAWGELVLGGHSLARGYHGRAAQTAQTFVPHPWPRRPGERLYRTGDRVRHLADGQVDFQGRLDLQVKVRGFRIEPGEIERALLALGEVSAAVVEVRHHEQRGPQLVAYVVPRDSGAHQTGSRELGAQETSQRLREQLEAVLPPHLVPGAFVSLDEFPLNASGKVDRKALPAPPEAAVSSRGMPRGEMEGLIAEAWAEVLGVQGVGREKNFFEAGGHSLLLARLATLLEEKLGRAFTPVELLRFPTIGSLAEHLEPISKESVRAPQQDSVAASSLDRGRRESIAIVGVAGRFPGANNVDELWRLLSDGKEAISPLTEEDLIAAGVPEEDRRHPRYVPVASRLAGIADFDAAFFGLSPREAEILDPQQRLFLECSWEALEDAAYVPGGDDRTGVFAGLTKSSYLSRHLETRPELVRSVGAYQLTLANDKDFLPTRVAYRLGLRGPAVAVQTACSTSLVAVHMACQSLRQGECDVALAGGVSVRLPQEAGYRYESGMILSPDGHCRPFDEQAGGTVGGNGAGVVALKLLSAALRDGDSIRAVIRGSAINNDGSLKAGYTAPSVPGQALAISTALESAGVEPASIGYVEAHGTGTVLGDPIEVEALNQVFGSVRGGSLGAGISKAGSAKPNEANSGGASADGVIALGSIKGNLGHLDAAAGITGLIKTVLCLEQGEIPPSLHFETPNPRINFAGGPFRVQRQSGPFPRRGSLPLRAGVSSFGIGGTNAHAVLEEAPQNPATVPGSPFEILPLAGRTETALNSSQERLAEHLERMGARGEISAKISASGPEAEGALGDVALTLQTGRRAFQERSFVVCRSLEDAAAALRDPARRLQRRAAEPSRPVAFLFPGQGSQYFTMAQGLYHHFEVFKREVDRCADLLQEDLGLDLRSVIFSPQFSAESSAHLSGGGVKGGPETETARKSAEDRLRGTALAQPALFAVQYALASLWRSLGVEGEALLGHSIGEYVAACWAGVMELPVALRLVAARGRLIQDLPGGSMVSVGMGEESARELLAELTALGTPLDLAALNGPTHTVLSGSSEAIAAVTELLEERGVDHRSLHTSHAFHSRLLDPALGAFREVVEKVDLKAPSTPFLSNVTGTWILPEEATDPEYWVEHLRRPVRFLPALEELGERYQLLEVGPGRSLSTFARAATGEAAISTLRHPRRREDDLKVFLEACGRLWLAGTDLNWVALHGPARRRLHLPTYPFERQRFWVEPGVAQTSTSPSPSPRPQRLAREEWFHRPAWRSAPPLLGEAKGGGHPVQDGASDLACGEMPEESPASGSGAYLLYLDPEGIGEALARRLRQNGKRVVTVAIGKVFESLGADAFAIHPARPEDTMSLLGALGDQLPRHFVHLWNCGPVASALPSAEALRHRQELSFSSLIALAKALPEEGLPESRQPKSGQPKPALPKPAQSESKKSGHLQLLVASQGVYRVLAADPVDPARALLLGPCRVLPLEQPALTCRHVDLPSQEEVSVEDLADLLARELTARELTDQDPAAPAGIPQDSSVYVAWRGGQRWHRCFEPTPLPQVSGPRLAESFSDGLPSSGSPPPSGSSRSPEAPKAFETHPVLRPKGVYLITGGFGGVGLEVAHYLAKRAAARLVLVGRHPLPAQGAWQQRLERDGGEVLALAADVTDEESMGSALAAARERFGALHGVIHAAGMAGGGLTRYREAAAMEEVLAPKLQGTWVLAKLLAGDSLDFTLLCSSLTSELGGLGQADYAAANAFLDSFSESGWLPSVTTVNWDLWRGLGMAQLPLPEDLASLRKAMEAFAMSPLEGCEVLERAIASPLRRVAVSTTDLARRLAGEIYPSLGGEEFARPGEPAEPSSSGSKSLRTPPPPAASPSSLEVPGRGLEAMVARLWQELLGVEAVGIHDDFFELGGHSLMGTRVLARLEDEVGLSLPLSALFEHSTIAQLAAELERRGAEPKEVPLPSPKVVPIQEAPLQDVDSQGLDPISVSLFEDPGDHPELSDEAVDSLLLTLLAEEV